MRSRIWSIRSKIIALVTVPLVALLALWIFATALTAGPAFNLLSARTLLDKVGNPGEVLVGELQRERRLSVEYLSVTGPLPEALTQQRTATDRAIADFRSAAGGSEAHRAASDVLRTRIVQVFTELDTLPANRAHINRREVDPIGAQGMYNSAIDAGFEMFSATAAFNDEPIDRQIRGLTTIGRGQEYLSRVDSLLAGASAAGKFTADLRTEMLQDVGTARFLLTEGVNDMPIQNRTEYEQLSSGVAFSRLRTMQDTLVADSRAGAVTPVASSQWQPFYDQSTEQLRAFEIGATDSLAGRATPLAVTILVRLAAAGILGLLALIISIVVGIRVGRSIVGRLGRLQGEALEMSAERLPTVVRRLQRGEAVDIDAETPPLEYGKDEIGRLGQAFNAVQRTAVQSAIEEATVRRGINEVFLNIARRSQTLLHRQLALLDKMERRETEPLELEDLYRVDHLATRMRRHAEDLVILAGAAPGRGWRNPVPVIDVVRGAISEVEDYKRIDIQPVESSAVLGRAVGDIIHLLAELLENAASFSPPQTRVLVSGRVRPDGYAVEIEDRGLGMSVEALNEANRRLAEPPEFDPADSARLGLFVVAQLADRHRIQVSLRASADAGVTASVLIPIDLITFGSGPGALPASPSVPDPSWDRPPVRAAGQIPGRTSVAALPWHGTEELRQITAADLTSRPGHLELPAGRPVPVDGGITPIAGTVWIPAGPAQPDERDPAEEALPSRTRVEPGGPAPSSFAAGLSADGLVQRRRVRRPVDLGSADEAAARAESSADGRTGAGRTEVEVVLDRQAARAVAQAMQAQAMQDQATPAEATPAQVAQIAQSLRRAGDLDAFEAIEAGPRAVPRNSGPPLPGGSSTEDGLPRRVRQANLAPQLRRSVAVEEETATQRLRTPEQIRSIMSALQTGTTRGRIDASRYRDEPPTPPGAGTDRPAGNEDHPEAAEKVTESLPRATSFAEAATVSFPAIVNVALTGDETSSGARPGAAGDRAKGSGKTDLTRPEKDAK